MWAEHDATELVKGWQGEKLDVLIDVVCSSSFSASLSFPPSPSSNRKRRGLFKSADWENLS